jgi:hypothetical protein
MKLIVNRAFEFSLDAETINVCPYGDFPVRENGKQLLQRVDKDSAQYLVKDFDKRRAQNKNFPGVIVDFDHASEDVGKSSEAAGWINELFTDENGLNARVRWTDVGKTAISNGRFRLVSPSWDVHEVKEGGETVAIPVRLHAVALTNAPNIKGAIPITNRAPTSAAGEARTSDAEEVRLANRISRMAIEEQKATGCSLASAYSRVMNRGKENARSAALKFEPAQWAMNHLMRLAGVETIGSMAGNVIKVSNRLPRLAKIANRQGGLDLLAEGESAARAAYSKAAYDGKLEDFTKAGSKGRRLAAAISQLGAEHPDLGYDGRYEKLKEESPITYWEYVAQFVPDMNGLFDSSAVPAALDEVRTTHAEPRMVITRHGIIGETWPPQENENE